NLAFVIVNSDRQPIDDSSQKPLIGVEACPELAKSELLEQGTPLAPPSQLRPVSEPKLDGQGKEPVPTLESTGVCRDSCGRVSAVHPDPRPGDVVRTSPGLDDVRGKPGHDGREQQMRQRPPHRLQKGDAVKSGGR